MERSRRRRARGLARNRRGLTILELLVVMGILGIMAGLVLPALGAAREAARRIECTSHLRQIGLAIHNYHDLHQSLPPGWRWDATKRSAYSWAFSLLPLLDQQPLHALVDGGNGLNDERLTPARETVFQMFLCPSDIAPAHFTLMKEPEFGTSLPLVELPAANYVGVYGTAEPDDWHPTPPGDGTFMDSRPVSFREFAQGLSNTFIVGERTASKLAGSWLGFVAEGEDAECRVSGAAITAPNCEACDECEFSSRHPGLSEFLFADGSVRPVGNSIDAGVFRRMARRREE